MTSTSRNYTTINFLLLLVSVFTIAPWVRQLMPSLAEIMIGWCAALSAFSYILTSADDATDKTSNIIKWYFIWMIIGCIRGILAIEIYMDARWFSEGALMLTLPLFAYYFQSPERTQAFLNYWMKWGMLVFCLFIFWVIGFARQYFGPIFIFSLFLFELPKKWKWIIGGILLIFTFLDLSNRATVILAVFSVAMAILFNFRDIISEKLIRLIHHGMYITAIVFLVLGIMGVFNIFQDFQSNQEGQYKTQRIVNGESIEEDLSMDTRTFIYEEVINSAIDNGYVWYGRTPARGNDDNWFADYKPDMRYGERHYNELCHPNVFTWLGLIGLILYSLIYFRASTLALYHSNNIYTRFLSVYIAFHWLFGWIEDLNTFNIWNIGAIWLIIGLCYSPYFRNMNDEEFNEWLLECLPEKIFGIV